MSLRVPQVVGFGRPAMEFPENPDDFFDFLNRKIAERFLHHKLDDVMIESIRQEAHQLLSVANDLYNLGVGRDFWVVKLERTDTHSIEGIVRPASIDRPVDIQEHEDGGFVAQIAGQFVRAPTRLEALVGLGKVFKQLGGLETYEKWLVIRGKS